MNRTINFVKRKSILVTSMFLVIAIIIGVLACIPSHAEEFLEENPGFTLDLIDSDVETSQGGEKYLQTSTFEKTSENTYTLTSNAFVAWWSSDDVAFANNLYNISKRTTEEVTMEMTIDSFGGLNNSTLNQNASVGLMIRSSLDPGASNLFLHLRPSGENKGMVIIVYRSFSKDQTQVSYWPSLDLPISLKATKKGQAVYTYYKGAKDKEYKACGSWGIEFPTTDVYLGMASHSTDKNTYITADFSNVLVYGTSSNYIPHEGGTSEGQNKPEEIPEEPPATEDTLLRETFNDGSMIEGKESAINPIWWGMDTDPQIVDILGKDEIEGEESKNKAWYKDTAGNNYVGSTTWTDYEVSVDFKFDTENIDSGEKNVFKLYARHMENPFYGHSDMAAMIWRTPLKRDAIGADGRPIIDPETGKPVQETYYEDKIALASGRSRGKSAPGNGSDADGNVGTEWISNFDNNPAHTTYVFPEGDNYLDGQWHTLTLRVFDATFVIYYDGEEVINFTAPTREHYLNNKFMSTNGAVGVGTSMTAVYIDNLVAKKLEDEWGGSYDNAIQGNWDSPTPDFYDKWIENGYSDPYLYY